VFGMFTADDYAGVRGTDVYDAPAPIERFPGLPGHLQAICGCDEESFLVARTDTAG